MSKKEITKYLTDVEVLASLNEINTIMDLNRHQIWNIFDALKFKTSHNESVITDKDIKNIDRILVEFQKSLTELVKKFNFKFGVKNESTQK